MFEPRTGPGMGAYDLVLCLKIRPPVLDFVRGAYVVDFTNLANDITNQSREFYRGGSSTLLTREQTINKYRPKSVAVLVSLLQIYRARLSGCDTCACICAEGKPTLWSMVTAEETEVKLDF